MTKIYRIGSGIVLAEASCVAVNIETGRIKAIGNDAKQLLGRTAEFTAIHFPVSGGIIKDEKLAVVMLRHFLQKTEIKTGQFINVHAIICVPCGINSEGCSAYYRVADKCGIGKISFVEVPYLAATGMNAPMSDISPVFSIDIGGGATNIAVVSLDGIIAGLSINVGGENIDKSIADKIAETAGLRIGPLTSEKLKNEVGSLIDGDGRSQSGERQRYFKRTPFFLKRLFRIYCGSHIEAGGSHFKICRNGIAKDIRRSFRFHI